MSGENPYIEPVDAKLPETGYTVRFFHDEELLKEVQVDPQALPRGDGRPGSLLRTALAAGVQIDHTCGGVCACSTCHVIVRKGLESCNASTDDEEDQLDYAPGLTDQSRLACQTVPDGTVDLEVVVPSWNRNLAQEGH